MNERRDAYDLASVAMALSYVASAIVIIAVYRAPIVAMATEARGWYRAQQASGARSIRGLSGRLWNDVREAIDNA